MNKIQEALNEAADKAADQYPALEYFRNSDFTDMFILGHKWTLDYYLAEDLNQISTLKSQVDKLEAELSELKHINKVQI